MIKKILAIVSTVVLVIGFSLSAGAGTIADTDGDLIPDVFDNCRLVPNGPGDVNNQLNTDASLTETIGDVCDCDYDNSGFVLGNDILAIFAVFNGSSDLHDNTGDGFILGDDVLFCFGQFNGTPGPGSSAI